MPVIPRRKEDVAVSQLPPQTPVSPRAARATAERPFELLGNIAANAGQVVKVIENEKQKARNAQLTISREQAELGTSEQLQDAFFRATTSSGQDPEKFKQLYNEDANKILNNLTKGVSDSDTRLAIQQGFLNSSAKMQNKVLSQRLQLWQAQTAKSFDDTLAMSGNQVANNPKELASEVKRFTDTIIPSYGFGADQSERLQGVVKKELTKRAVDSFFRNADTKNINSYMKDFDTFIKENEGVLESLGGDLSASSVRERGLKEAFKVLNQKHQLDTLQENSIKLERDRSHRIFEQKLSSELITLKDSDTINLEQRRSLDRKIDDYLKLDGDISFAAALRKGVYETTDVEDDVDALDSFYRAQFVENKSPKDLRDLAVSFRNGDQVSAKTFHDMLNTADQVDDKLRSKKKSLMASKPFAEEYKAVKEILKNTLTKGLDKKDARFIDRHPKAGKLLGSYQGRILKRINEILYSDATTQSPMEAYNQAVKELIPVIKRQIPGIDTSRFVVDNIDDLDTIAGEEYAKWTLKNKNATSEQIRDIQRELIQLQSLVHLEKSVYDLHDIQSQTVKTKGSVGVP